MSATQMQPAAGWYNDDAGVLRYWDGFQWTPHVAPPQPYAVAPAAPQVVVNQRKAYKTSHGFHLIMSLITFGLWLPIWLVVGLVNAARA